MPTKRKIKITPVEKVEKSVKKPESKAVIYKKIDQKTNPKILKKTKEIKISQPGINSSSPLAKKSPFIINLKTPRDDFFQKHDFVDQTEPSLKLPATQPKIKPPRIIPKNTAKVTINFLGRKNSILEIFTELSLVKITKLVFWPLIKLFQFLNKKSYQKLESIAQDSKEEIEDIFAPSPDFKFFGFFVPKNWYKSVGIFIIISLILISPFQALSYYQQLQETKDRVLLLTNEAIANLKEAQQAVTSFDLNTANYQFNAARQNFSLAQEEINQINALTTELLKLIPGQGKTVTAGLTLLSAGETLAEVGQILSTAGNNYLSGQTGNYYQILLGLKSDLESSLTKFLQAKDSIEKIKISDLSVEHQATFAQILEKLPIIEDGLTDLYTLNSALLKILGEDQWQRYLVIFTNNGELRGSGGFMGSFALVDIDRGQIKKIDIPAGGTYDLQGALIPKVISPEPLHLINPRWEFQDANWWPDFPTTAQKIQWFYQNASGPSTDGVILITATLMERILEVIGPIEMPEYGRVINSQNFVQETQKIVELEYDKEENRPKQFIADLAPKLLEKIFTVQGDTFKKLLATLHQGLNEKHLLLDFNNPDFENLILSLDWGGKLKDTQGDFLSVVNTNLAGGKTDEVISEVIEHQAEVLADGSIINTVKLIRTHHGIRGENIFTGVQNNSYIRFYTPAGSTLLEAGGFKKPADKYFESPSDELTPDLDLIRIETDKTVDENSGTDIYKENGKTVFGNWLSLQPGETKEVYLKYRLPFKISEEGKNTFYYSLLTQKQSGSQNSKLISSLKLNNQLKPLAKYPANLEEEGNIVKFSADLATDQFYGVALVSN